MPSADVSASTTSLPPATVGPAVDGTSPCPLGQGVVACIVAALVVVIVFLAALAFSVLVLACSQPRREPRRIHGHHRKRHRRRSHAARHHSRRHREEGAYEDALRGARQPELRVSSMIVEHDSSGRSSPDASGSPYHPRYNSPATSVCCEEFRMPSCTCHGCSDCSPILHSTMATRTTAPLGGDASESTSRGSDRTVNAGALSEAQSLEWDNFQPPLLATRACSSVTHLDITDGESLSVAGGSHQEQQRPLKQPTEGQQWV